MYCTEYFRLKVGVVGELKTSTLHIDFTKESKQLLAQVTIGVLDDLLQIVMVLIRNRNEPNVVGFSILYPFNQSRLVLYRYFSYSSSE